MTKHEDKYTKVFRAEILKPINYTWEEFNATISKATYQSAKIANEVMTKQLLIGKKEIEKEPKFCSMISTCKEIPLSFCIKCAVCQHAKLKYRASAKKLLRSDISLPTFKNNTFYIRDSGVKITRTDNGEWMVRLSIFPIRTRNQPKVILRTRKIAEQAKGYYQILERISSKEYKLGICQLKKDKVRNKLYILMSYTFTHENETPTIPTRVMGVDLGVATPAYCAFNDSVKRLSLFVEGDKLLQVKQQIQGRRRKIIKGIDKQELRRGHGLSGKFYPTQQLQTKWVNFRRTWNHTLSSRIVGYALEEQASTIHIEDLPMNGIPRFLGKDWPVAELLQMITYKGEEAGLIVERVNPYKTSQTCSHCGTIKENFTFKDRVEKGMPIFTCDCGFQDNADYNAAKNIAKSILITK